MISQSNRERDWETVRIQLSSVIITGRRMNH